MTEVLILPTTPGALKRATKVKLEKAGVIVVEANNPHLLRLLRPDAEINGGGMLYAALQAVMKSGNAQQHFSIEIHKQVAEAFRKSQEPA